MWCTRLLRSTTPAAAKDQEMVSTNSKKRTSQMNNMSNIDINGHMVYIYLMEVSTNEC